MRILTNVTIGQSVTSIGDSAFANCTSLTGITVDALNSAYVGVGGVLFNRNLAVIIQYPGGKTGSYVISNSVTNIGNNAFESCTSLLNVTIPDGVTSIGDRTFDGCTSLTNLTIGNMVSNIGDYAFSGCTNLMGVYFKGNSPSVGVSPVSSATIYYLPGTTGWGTTFGGRPTKLWNPQVQTGDASFGVRTNRFGFNIIGTANIPLIVEASPNLANPVWDSLQSCTLTNGSHYFNDPQWTNHPARYYRIRSP